MDRHALPSTAAADPGLTHPGLPLRIAIVAPPMLPIPPVRYAGTERVIATLADGLAARGHHVTLFAAGDSTARHDLVPIVPRALWPAGYRGDTAPYVGLAAAIAWREAGRFDIIHSHLDSGGFALARYAPVPVVSTLHTRLDIPGPMELIEEFHEVPLVSVSQNQRRWHPGANWVATVHNGLPLAAMPFQEAAGTYLAFVGRVVREKGVAESVELARATGLTLRIAAKVMDAAESAFFESVVRPAIGEEVEFLGEVGPADRDPLLAGALATLMLGAWPEPFGLVAIESLATGTPVIARRVGALPEIIEHGVDGFLVDDVQEAQRAVELVPRLDRARIRERALERFSADRMVEAYEHVYRDVIASHGPGARDSDRTAVRRAPLPVFAFNAERPRARRSGEPWVGARPTSEEVLSSRPTPWARGVEPER
jgi:glycosyltransferase involved in cell wall biosynthesis